jgi:hypothetical protein
MTNLTAGSDDLSHLDEQKKKRRRILRKAATLD